MRPAKRPSQVALVPIPKGLTMPIPVTTTRRRAAAMLVDELVHLLNVRVCVECVDRVSGKRV